ncbi:MAG: FecR domain-containing protein [Gammaproteobacteria bacterium]
MSASDTRSRASVIQEAADWHARLRSESLSEVEEVRFRAWLSGDPSRRREFDELSALWDKLEGVAQSPEVLGELHPIARRPASQAVRGPVSRRALVGWAVAASVAGTVGVVSWEQWFASDTYATGVGEQRIVPLGDGSVVTLNTSSKVRVRFSRGQRRIEILGGQAHFEVAKDASRPFIVSAGGGEVLALGTVFDVYQRAGDIVVTLIEGRVAVVPDVAPGESGASARLISSTGAPSEAENAGLHAIVLTAGEQVAYGASGKAPVRSDVDLRRASAWRDRKLDFADTPLVEAIAEANRYSRLKVELRAPQFADARISGVFEAGRNEPFAEGVRAYFGLRVERAGEDLIVLTPGAR